MTRSGITILCLLGSLLIQFVECGPTCLWCQASSISTDCKYTKQCSDHEVCYTVQTINGNGHTHLEMGCRDTRQCGATSVFGRSVRQSGFLVACSECCTGDLCNSALCGQHGYPTGGPICYSCNQRLYHNECNVVKQCGTSQVCTIKYDLINQRYDSYCEENMVCDNIHQTLQQVPVGKRQTQTPTIYAGNKCLFKCCNSSLCNKECQDRSTETTNVPTPIDGMWVPWTSWSRCSVTCGMATTTRSRYCHFPFPEARGHDCIGLSKDQKSCENQLCSVDGVWSNWHHWGGCSTTCGGGTRTRPRACQYPSGATHGHDCVGLSTSHNSCNTKSCPVDGVWSSWHSLVECSATCGGGTRTRHRDCQYPAGATHGHDCVGSSTSHLSCNTKSCPGLYN